jgi:hypothetical protein
VQTQHRVGCRHAGRRRLVRQDHALAVGRGPGGEADERGVELGQGGRSRRLALEPAKREPRARTLSEGAGHIARPELVVAGPRQAAVQLHLARDLGGLRRREVARERNQAGVGGEEPEGRGKIREVVRREEADPLTRLDPVAAQKGGHPLGFVRELAVAQRAARAHVGHGGPAPVPRRGVVEDAREVHVGRLTRRDSIPGCRPHAR